MAILAAIPVINCNSIQRTLDFYLQLFRFVVVQKRELDGCLQWVHLRHGSTSLMLKRVEPAVAGQASRASAGVSLYLYVDDIRDVHHYIRAKNQTVSDIVLQQYRMYEFTITDPEGNTVTVGQDKQPPVIS